MRAITIGKQMLSWGSQTYVMGVLNITPDSFSGDGIMNNSDAVDAAVEQARRFLSDGADILDIGGESTRPGSTPLESQEELDRVMPVIQALVAQFPGVLMSIDTYKSRVAEAAFKVGVQILNDVWALRADPDLAALAAQYEAIVVLMHNRSDPKSIQVRDLLGNAYHGADYQDLMEDVKRELMQSVQIAREAGIPDSHIILDPGVGFGKTREQNLELINRLGEIRALGYPVLLGPSRKSFIGYTLDLPPDQRLEGTAAAAAVGIVRGADILRVHDVRAIVRLAKMTDAILRAG
jgi:dihydropteroate synthase